MHRIQRGSQPRRPSSHQAPVGGLAGGLARPALLVAAAALAAVGIAGCSDPAGTSATVVSPRGGPPAGWTPSPTASPAPAAPAPASTAPASTAPASTAPASTAPASAAPGVTPSAPAAAPAAPTPSEAGAVAPDGGLCPTSRLTVRSADAEGAAGSTYEKLVLTNTGSATCLLRGFPGVSYVDAAGRQVGAPAVRTGPAGASARLAPGASATATLRTVHPGLQEGCEQTSQTTPVAALRIYPPANTTALRLPLSGVSACVNPAVQQLSVTTLTR